MTISCKPCLQCPLGQQLLLPCGSTTKSETFIKCRKCPPDTYKESQGIGKCKPCQTCGLRETISQCTPEKNTQCGVCPRGYYQEDCTLDSCTSCTQQLKIKESSVLKSEDFSKLFATESTGPERAVTQRKASQSDNPADARNWVLENIVPQLKKSKFKREVNVTMQSAESRKRASQRVEEASTQYTFKERNSTPATPASVEGNGAASLTPPHSKLHEGFGTVFDASVEEPTMLSNSSNSGNGNKLLIILIVLVGIAIVLHLITIIMSWKNQSGQFPGSNCTVTCCAKNVYFTDVGEHRSLTRDTFQTGEATKYNF